MPKLTEACVRLHMHLFGYAKTRKTWWAESAAEAGFNVLIIDGDGGYSIGANNLNEEAKNRLYALDFQDKPNEFIFSKYVFNMMKHNSPWYVDEAKREMKNVKLTGANLMLQLSKCTTNDVVIVDSYTALVSSLYLYHAQETKTIDLLVKTTWDDYAYAQNWSSQFFTYLRALPCHFILVNHAQIMGAKQVGGAKTERLSPIGTSSNQAATISRYFNELLYFGAKNGKITTISSAGSHDRDGGSRLIPPADYNFYGTGKAATDMLASDKTLPANFDFKAYCKLANIAIPVNAPPSDGWKILT